MAESELYNFSLICHHFLILDKANINIVGKTFKYGYD